MGDEVCQFSKFEYCKFQENCKRKHLNEVCETLSGCKNIKYCQKRHPKICKRFDARNNCRSNEKCSYHYQNAKSNDEQKEIKKLS